MNGKYVVRENARNKIRQQIEYRIARRRRRRCHRYHHHRQL